MKSHWQILGVPENASTEDIKKAYRQKAKALHPDVNKAPGAAEQFIEVTEAYLYLTERRYTRLIKKVTPTRKRKMTDEEKREAYRERPAGMPGCVMRNG